MIHVGLQPRPVTAEDHHQISNLLFNEANIHRHLDWRTPLEWIGTPNFWALEEYGRIVATLACPEDPSQVAWIRLFGYQPHLSAYETWSVIWEAAHRDICITSPQMQVAAIITKQWFQNLLIASGFEIKQNIVLLESVNEKTVPFSESQDFRIRNMRRADLPSIVSVDLDAFGAFWHNTKDTLERVFGQSVYATVAEDDSGVIGYQISTGNLRGVHLARLAVRERAQGRGVGFALARHLMQQVGMRRLSVNTQDDNRASLSLYKKLGFIRIGEYFPVLIYPTS
jgi:ribosomal protein S18 acetylase RimI-like enzyme